MQQTEFEKGLLAMAAWRLARSSDVNELLAILCTLRNWVTNRGLMHTGLYHFKTYTEVVENFLAIYPVRSLPMINEPALIDPREGLLAVVDGVYDNTRADITSSHANPSGARYFGVASEVGTGSWFDEEVLKQPHIHKLIGKFGSQQFYE